MEQEITTLLFDLGNVILFFDHERIVRNIRDRVPVRKTDLELADAVGKIIRSFEEGGMQSQEFYHAFLARLEVREELLSLSEFSTAWSDIFSRNETLIHHVRGLAARYRLGLISNTNELHVSFIREHFPDVFVPFQVCVFSHEERMRKPVAEIYQRTMERLRSRPGECLYVDDIKEYVAAAASLGIRGVEFRSTGQLIEAFRTHGIHV